MENQHEQDQAQLSWESIKSAATVFAAEESLNLIGHWIVGNYSGMVEMAIFGGIAALAAGYNAPGVLRQLQAVIPHSEKLEPFRLLTHAEPGKRSVVDRLFDRHPAQADIEEALDDGDDIQEAYVLDLGITFRPHPDYIFSNRIAILGMPGVGKSNAVAVFAEELGQFDAPFVIFDQKPEYAKLCSKKYLNNPWFANASNLSPEDAYEFGQRIMDERLQVVLDLASYNNDDYAAIIMINLLVGVREWEAARTNEFRIPFMAFLEEADYWLPQSEQFAHVNKKKDDEGKSLFNQLQAVFFHLVNRGRSWGMGIIASTQRPANIDNRLIAPCEWKLLLKANQPNDLKVYRAFGCDPDVAPVLCKGEAFVIGPDIRQVFQMRLRNSPDDAATPGLENLQRKQPTKAEVLDRNVPTPLAQFEHKNEQDRPERSARNNDLPPASQDDGSTDLDDGTNERVLPDGWTEKKAEMLIGFYRVFNSIDKALMALDLAQSQRNRECARNLLKEQGLR